MRRLLHVIVGSAAVALAGCGTDQTFVEMPDKTLRVALDEYRLTPENIRVDAGRVTLIARNVGRLTHNVHVQAFDRLEGEPYEDFGGTRTAHPGETVTETLRLSPGKYRIVCTIGNHDDLGQFGELQVRKR